MKTEPLNPPSRPAPLSMLAAPGTARGSVSGPPVGGPWHRRVGRSLAMLACLAVVGIAAAAMAHGLTTWMTPAWAAALAAGSVAGSSLGAAVLLLRRQAGRLQRASLVQPVDSATTDPAAQFLAQAGREFARSRRYGTGAALLLVEIDRLARINESRGLAAARAVLAELMRQTAPTLRTADVLMTFSASQVAVFLAHADATGALDVAERIRERTEKLEIPLLAASPQAPRLRVTVSVGVAHLRPAHLHLQAVLDDAQDAVTAARSAGGNCVRAAPVDAATGAPGGWRERRARPKQGGTP